MGSFHIFFLFFLHSIIHTSGICSISQCSSSNSDNITVRFPFQIEGRQPEYCGYPGFNLRCNNQGKTVLKLPYSGDFLVRRIDYLTQQVQLYDSDNCLPKRTLNFNLSGSPFVPIAYLNYTFLSCPTDLIQSRFTTIDCLSNSTTSVLATSSKSIAGSLSMSKTCRIMIELSVPVSWPEQYDEGFSNELNKDLRLVWYSPACETCEEDGGVCGFKTNTSQEIGCFHSNTDQSTSTSAVGTLKVVFFSIAIPSMILAAGIASCAFFTDRRPDRNRGNSNQNSGTTATIMPQPETAVGLDETTIESYEKVMLGESMRFPAGWSDSTCAICLAEYHSNEMLRCIPECKHCFHLQCIDEWLRMNGSCPVCRNKPSPADNESLNV